MSKAYLSRKHLCTEFGHTAMKESKITPRQSLAQSSREEAKPKRVFYRDLEKRGLTGLFSVNSPDRLRIPNAYRFLAPYHRQEF